MPANLENSAVATGLEKYGFHSNPKKDNAKRCSNYHTIALISHASRVMLKILQARLQQYVNQELPDVRAGFRKGRGTQRSNCQHPSDHRKSKGIPEKHILCFINYAKPFDCVDHSNLYKNFKEMGIPHYLACLLRNLHACQEASVRTGHRTTDWFRTGKGVHQSCILLPCLFNFYAEYLM